MWRSSREATLEHRAKLGLEPVDGPYCREFLTERRPVVLSCSPILFERPVDWGDEIAHCPGITLSPELRRALGEYGLDPELDSWLAEGSPPIYFGFGSMPILEPQETLAVVRRVLDRLRARAVISTGWSKMAGASDDRIRFVDAVDHDALFPRCQAAVHHGGAGTTYATLRAGIPALICSVLGDQPFWGSRLFKLGIGATLPFQKFSEARLQRGLEILLRPQVIAAAREAGVRAAAEEGLPAVCDAILRAAESTPPPR